MTSVLSPNATSTSPLGVDSVDSVDSVDGVDGDGPAGRMTRRMLDAPTPIYEDSMGGELVDKEEALLSDRTL